MSETTKKRGRKPLNLTEEEKAAKYEEYLNKKRKRAAEYKESQKIKGYIRRNLRMPDLGENIYAFTEIEKSYAPAGVYIENIKEFNQQVFEEGKIPVIRKYDFDIIINGVPQKKTLQVLDLIPRTFITDINEKQKILLDSEEYEGDNNITEKYIDYSVNFPWDEK